MEDLYAGGMGEGRFCNEIIVRKFNAVLGSFVGCVCVYSVFMTFSTHWKLSIFGHGLAVFENYTISTFIVKRIYNVFLLVVHVHCRSQSLWFDSGAVSSPHVWHSCPIFGCFDATFVSSL